MPDPTTRQSGRPDTLLTNVALSYARSMGDIYVADKVFPVVPVDFQSAKYKVFPRSYFLRDEVGPRPIGGYPRQVGYKMSEDSYSATNEALEAVIADAERVDYQGPVSGPPEAAKVRLLQRQHQHHRDQEWAGKDGKVLGVGSPAEVMPTEWLTPVFGNPVQVIDGPRGPLAVYY